MKISMFVGTSVDGFIARYDGDFDFLPEGGGEPHGYTEFIATVDVIPLFGSLPRDVQLRPVSTSTYASGLVKREYEVAGH